MGKAPRTQNLLLKASQHHRSGRLKEAERCYRSILRKRPGWGMVWNCLGAVLESRGEVKEALKVYQRAFDAKNSHTQALYNIGRLKQISGDFRGALDAYQNLLKTMPDFGPAWAELGNLLRELGEIEDGISCLKKGASLCPDRPDILNNLGVALDEAGDAAGAIDVLHRAANIAPGYISPLFNLAQIFHRQGNYSRAEQLYKKVLELRPGDKRAEFLLQCINGEHMPEAAPAEYVRHLFDNCARNFEETLVKKLEYRTPELLFNAVYPYLKKEMTILDLGCGTGLGSELYRPYAAYLAGMDASPRMLALAAAKDTYQKLSQQDINRPWNLDRHFDLIYSCDCFVYIGDLLPVLSEAALHLKSKGILAFSVEELPEGQGDFRLLPAGRYAHSKSYLEKLLDQLGFCTLFLKGTTIRKEGTAPVRGLLLGARRG